MGRQSVRDTMALTSAMCFVSSATDRSVAPIALLICAALSSKLSSAAGGSGGNVGDAVGAGLAWLLLALQPATAMQNPASVTAIRYCITPQYRKHHHSVGVNRSISARAWWS